MLRHKTISKPKVSLPRAPILRSCRRYASPRRAPSRGNESDANRYDRFAVIVGGGGGGASVVSPRRFSLRCSTCPESTAVTLKPKCLTFIFVLYAVAGYEEIENARYSGVCGR